MKQTPAKKILLFEETPDTELYRYLRGGDFEVHSRIFPDAGIFNAVAELQPELLVTYVTLPISQKLVETAAAIRTRYGLPVVYLAAPAAESLLKRTGIDHYLTWPKDKALLHARLTQETRKTPGRDGKAATQAASLPQSDWLFRNSPIPLSLQDLTGVRREVQALKDNGVKDLRAYFAENPAEVERCFRQLEILDVNQAFLNLYRASSKAHLLANVDKALDPLAHNLFLEEVIAVGEGRTQFQGEGINFDLEGNLLYIRLSWSISSETFRAEKFVCIVSIVDMTEHKHKHDMLQLLALITAALRNAQTRTELLTLVMNQLSQHMHISTVALAFPRPDDREVLIERAGGEWAAAAGRSILIEEIASGFDYSSSRPFIQADIRRCSQFALSDLVKNDTAVMVLPLQTQQKTIGQLWVAARTALTQVDEELLNTLTDIVANAIHRTTLLEQSQRYAEQVATVSAIGRALSTTLDVDEVYERLAQGLIQLLPDIDGIYISSYDNQKRLVSYAYALQDGERLDLKKVAPIPLDSPNAGSQSEVIRTRQPLITNDLQNRRRMMQTTILGAAQAADAQSGIYVPMLAKDEIMGVLYVQSYTTDRFTRADGELLSLVANTGAVAVQNARLFAATQRQVQRLTALHAIDVAISSNLDLRITLNTLLEQMLALLPLDAADILMLDSASQMLQFASGRGFRAQTASRTAVMLGSGLAGRAALESRAISINKIDPQDDPRADIFLAEGINACSAAPLVSKGQVKGVLEIYFRRPVELDLEWEEFLETLAGQVAVAIDNATLVSQLQRTNMDLTLAYDTTLEGWARALYLRDRETESHTRRVTEYSVRLAKAMGLSDSELVNVRRGALLHDIGKLGIPDNILLKTGPLTETEWSKMQRHPEYANDMLRDINFLGNARLIPYCHHEKWDGSGYPQGLKGEEIPLSARIFSVADVWDSLLSDRPYRPAWPREKVRAYIESHAGTHFDPQVVEAFLKIMA